MNSANHTILFANLSLPRKNEKAILHRIETLVSNGDFILGKEVEAFEEEFAAYCEAPKCVGVASGCDALLWMLEALGIGLGDEVVTVANTFVGTVLPILRCGAIPVLVDCEPTNLQMNHEQVAAAITPRTKAILAVHLYGKLAPMNELSLIANKHSLALLEDAAQAHGARYRGRRTGSLGLAAGFSFYPAKNLGAWGDGGAIVTIDEHLAERVQHLRNYGQKAKYEHAEIGWNSRLDSLQAIVLSEKLKLLDGWSQKRRKVAEAYRNGLRDLPLRLLESDPADEEVYHLFPIICEERNGLQAALAASGIQSGIHYPVPIHKHQAFENEPFVCGTSFPVAESASTRLLSLPMHHELPPEGTARVIETIHRYYQS